MYFSFLFIISYSILSRISRDFGHFNAPDLTFVLILPNRNHQH